jgi:predicted ribosome quality control (RQC) complex YloA/Tae2 family protein
MSDPTPATPGAVPDPGAERAHEVRRALKRLLDKHRRRLQALQGDLAEAESAPTFRRHGEALLAYAQLVPPRVASVELPDPADDRATLLIALDPAISAPANAARYFKRAAKAERGQREVPPRIEALEREIASLRDRLAAHTAAPDDAAREQAQLELERLLFALSSGLRQQIRAPEPLPRRRLGLGDAPEPAKGPTTAAPRKPQPEGGGKLNPWRFKSAEGWDVLIGRTSEGNDHLTLHLARPEDYWFHAHGCPGSHVVLRRGKGPNEPSKTTLEEVASWAAFHSKARTAGKVPVNYTLKKYVRKPRGAKAGLVMIERERTLMVRPAEPPREQMAGSTEP